MKLSLSIMLRNTLTPVCASVALWRCGERTYLGGEVGERQVSARRSDDMSAMPVSSHGLNDDGKGRQRS